MATLETQYKCYLIENPTSTYSFEEWKENILKKTLEKVTSFYLDEDLKDRDNTLSDELPF